MSAKKFFTKELLKWNKYDNDRVMPWKYEKDPYKIWISEIILQQTRVSQGLEYYNRFIGSISCCQFAGRVLMTLRSSLRCFDLSIICHSNLSFTFSWNDGAGPSTRIFKPACRSCEASFCAACCAPFCVARRHQIFAR